MPKGSKAAAQLASLHDWLGRKRSRLDELNAEIDHLDTTRLDERRLLRALADFDEIWEALTGDERVRLVHLLIEKVSYNAATQNVTINFRPTGLESYIEENS